MKNTEISLEIFKNIVRKNFNTLFLNRDELKILLNKYLEKKFKGKFFWGIFFLYIRLIKKKSLDYNDWVLASKIEIFIICTDILDDLMDGDSSFLENTIQEVLICKEAMYTILDSIIHNLDVGIATVFEENLLLSLAYQFLDLTNHIERNYPELEYFSEGVGKSIYLVNAVVQLALEATFLQKINFSSSFAIYNQIENDIENIYSRKISDILQNKATLPIIKSFQAVNSDELDLLVRFFFERESINPENIRKIISNSGAIEYSRYIRNEYRVNSRDQLYNLFPKSSRYTSELIQYLNLND